MSARMVSALSHNPPIIISRPASLPFATTFLMAAATVSRTGASAASSRASGASFVELDLLAMSVPPSRQMKKRNARTAAPPRVPHETRRPPTASPAQPRLNPNPPPYRRPVPWLRGADGAWSISPRPDPGRLRDPLPKSAPPGATPGCAPWYAPSPPGRPRRSLRPARNPHGSGPQGTLTPQLSWQIRSGLGGASGLPRQGPGEGRGVLRFHGKACQGRGPGAPDWPAPPRPRKAGKDGAAAAPAGSPAGAAAAGWGRPRPSGRSPNTPRSRGTAARPGRGGAAAAPSASPLVSRSGGRRPARAGRRRR